ncbi:MAG TPA: alpha/beta fold hydrolase, partial [Candidatus Limnocylindria bacterium]|nr:alpha/beta fold hydrolase [Candidatus Limnocylindria bacterium]
MNTRVRGALAAAGLVALTLWDQRARRALADRALALRVGDAILEYESTGSGAPVLVLHGSAGGFDQGTWLGHLLGLRDRRVIAVSRPGYLGTTDRATTDEAVDLIAAALDQLGIGRLAVIGVSGGGMAACRFAMRHPDRVNALVMLSAVSGPILTGSAVADAWHFTAASRDVNQAMLGALRSRSQRQHL